jgi:hypothetical protein
VQRGAHTVRDLFRTALLLLLAGGLFTQFACCAQVGPVVATRELRRDELIRQLGKPSFQEVTTIGNALTRRLIEDQDLLERIRQLAPDMRLEIVKWEAACWTGSGDYFVGLFNPDTGRILEQGGKALYAGRTQMT